MYNQSEQGERNNQSEQNLTLSSVLIKLSQKLCNIGSQAYSNQQILIKLLQRIDSNYFQQKFNCQQNSDYDLIIKHIFDYYSDKRNQKVKKIFLIQLPYVNKFQHVFLLVLDLAIKCNQHQGYIKQIFTMRSKEQEMLYSFFDDVMKRKYIEQLKHFSIEQHRSQDQLLEIKEQQYIQLKQKFDQVSRAYAQLLDNHQGLKSSFEKVSKENCQIMQQKYQLMQQLGIHHSSNFLQISQKYKKDMKQFEKYIQKLSKDLEQKNLQIKNKQQQMKQMSGSINNLNTWVNQKGALLQKNRKLQAQNEQLQNKQIKLKDQVQSFQQIIAKLKQDLQVKQKQLTALNRYKNKYKGIKEVHFQFKKNFVQKMRQG